MMKQSLAIVAAMASLAAVIFADAAVASPLAPAAKPAFDTNGGVELVQYRYCRAWRNECARRWGWGTWRFQRCLRIRGC